MLTTYRVDGEAFRADKPKRSEARYSRRTGPFSRDFDLHPDGERFAMSPAAEKCGLMPLKTR